MGSELREGGKGPRAILGDESSILWAVEDGRGEQMVLLCPVPFSSPLHGRVTFP